MKSIILGAIAVLCIGLGGYRAFVQPQVSPQDRACCESIVRAEYGTNPESAAQLSASCDDPGMVAMMDARGQSASANEAAANIALANQSDLFSTVVNFGLIGIGIGLLGAALARKGRKAQA